MHNWAGNSRLASIGLRDGERDVNACQNAVNKGRGVLGIHSTGERDVNVVQFPFFEWTRFSGAGTHIHNSNLPIGAALRKAVPLWFFL